MPVYVVDGSGDYVLDSDGDLVVVGDWPAPPLNPIRKLERTMAAMAHLMLCKFQGEQLTLWNLDDDPLDLYMLPYGGRNARGEYQTMKADALSGKFDIPLQAGFDGSNLFTGAAIDWNGSTFQVESIETDALNAVFTLAV